MSVLYIVLPLALLFAGGAVLVFILATRRGQFDDLETPARRMLFDEAPIADPVGADSGGRAGGATSPSEQKASEGQHPG
jgi:cbb3-type cytochrome oxidase maturation protein